MEITTLKEFTFTLDENVEWSIKRAKKLQKQVPGLEVSTPEWESLNEQLDELYAEIGFWVAHDYKL